MTFVVPEKYILYEPTVVEGRVSGLYLCLFYPTGDRCQNKSQPQSGEVLLIVRPRPGMAYELIAYDRTEEWRSLQSKDDHLGLIIVDHQKPRILDGSVAYFKELEGREILLIICSSYFGGAAQSCTATVRLSENHAIDFKFHPKFLPEWQELYAYLRVMTNRWVKQ